MLDGSVIPPFSFVFSSLAAATGLGASGLGCRGTIVVGPEPPLLYSLRSQPCLLFPRFWLARFAARRSAGACGCIHMHCLFAFERSAGVFSRVFLRLLPSSPVSFVFFFFFFFSTDLFSVTGAQGCWRRGACGWGAGGKATGVVYLPGVGSMCSLGGVRVLGTQSPLASYVVKSVQILAI